MLVVANPRATATSARQRDVMLHALASEAELEVVETAHRGHAAALACRAMRNGTDVVVALGGDGTANEVVNGLLTDGVHDKVPALGIVPTGSTNVFARALGLPNSPIEATGVLLEGLRSGSRRPVSMGRADDRWFIFTAGLGYDADVVAAVEGHRRRGKRSTHVLYGRAALRSWWRADRRKPTMHVELPDGTVYDDVFFSVLLNCDPWTFVGNTPLRPVPETDFESNLGLYARRRMGGAGFLWSMARMAGNSPHTGRRGAHTAHDLEGLTVWADEPMALQVDGDYLGIRDKVVFSSQTSAIRVVI
jgi:diacylglycerol kinase family enzyme